MNKLEFSNGFDTLINSYSNAASINLTEYEKSFFLTCALDAFVKELYSSSAGIISYECDEKTRRQLESLVITVTYDSDKQSNNKLQPLGREGKFFIHRVFELPKDCWYIVYEQINFGDSITCAGLKVANVLPVTHDDYLKVVKNPFRGPSSSRVLRLDKGEREVELVSNQDDYTYTVRYIKRPKPIILEDLPLEASIDRYTDDSDSDDNEKIHTDIACELPEQLHWQILDMAVKMAIARDSGYNTNSKS